MPSVTRLGNVPVVGTDVLALGKDSITERGREPSRLEQGQRVGGKAHDLHGVKGRHDAVDDRH